jgi:diguanylate cyclase (GGDEF)-like protein/PAS domain S-box-containing protein
MGPIIGNRIVPFSALDKNENYMPEAIRILHAEDRLTDAELVAYQLKRAGVEHEVRVVDTEPDFRQQLDEFRPHVILSDFTMPRFGGMAALEIARELRPDIPFIFVSGTIGEELAVDALKGGASDYVLKGNLLRLAPAIKRALRDAELQRAHRLAQEETARLANDLREREAGLRRAQAMASLAHVITGPEGRFESFSESMPNLLGVDPARTPTDTRAWLAWVHPDDRGYFRGKAIEAGRTGGRTELEYRLRRSDGAWISVRQVMEPMEEGAIAGMRTRWFNTIQDISEQKRSEAKIRESELRFQATFDQAAMGIAHVDLDGNLIMVNRRLASMLGYEAAEMAGMSLRAMSHPDDIEITRQMRAELQAGRIDTFTAEKRYLRKQGQVIWMRLTASLMRAPDGRILSEIVVLEDISERRRAEQILRIEHMVARCLADAEDTAAALNTIIRTICESEDWDLGRYFYLDEAAAVMRLDLSWGKADPVVQRFLAASRGLTFRLGEGLVGAAWQTGEPLWVADAVSDPRVKQNGDMQAANLRAAFRVPVHAAGKIVGMLAFSSHAVHPPDARLMQAMRVIGGQVGQFAVRQAQQKHIARLNRIHMVLSGINSLIVRAHDRAELFKDACRIAVEDGRFALAWIGMVDRAAIRLELVASHDTSQGYVNLIPLGLDQSVPGGLALAGRAVWERKAVVMDDIAADSHSHVLKEEALARGYRSIVALPLIVNAQVIGVLSLYADTPHFFDSEEMKLLLELAGDIAFALDHLEKSARLEYLAYYDPLTGLANRSLFEERLGQFAAEAARENRKLAVLMYDLVRFKTINDTFGRQAGDDLLKQVAERAVQAVSDRSWLGRLGRDNFVSLIPGVDHVDEVARHLHARLQAVLGAPFWIGDTELRVAAKVGVAIYPDDGDNAETLLKNAEVALKRAKGSAEPYLFFNQKMSEQVAEKLLLENQLRQAMEKQEFLLYYQPKLDLLTKQIVGVEALIRWQSPELGLVPPVRFIPLMEETGLILEVGKWALQQAAADYGLLAARGLTPPRIAVNVSPMQLRRADFVDTVRAVITQSAVPPGIDLEITESLVMEDVASNVSKLNEIRELGVSIAVDDFGTGYSSLAYLAKLPVQILKIDRSFIITMLEEPDIMSLVSTIISLAHSLRLKVVAEGVDAEEQAKMLRLLRCDQMQGYLFSKPLPLEALAALLEQHGK